MGGYFGFEGGDCGFWDGALADGVFVLVGVEGWGKSGVLADIRESVGHGGDVDGFGTVPVEEAFFHGEFSLGPVKVIFVQDESAGEDVAEEACEGCLAAGGAAGEGHDEGLFVCH